MSFIFCLRGTLFTPFRCPLGSTESGLRTGLQPGTAGEAMRNAHLPQNVAFQGKRAHKLWSSSKKNSTHELFMTHVVSKNMCGGSLWVCDRGFYVFLNMNKNISTIKLVHRTICVMRPLNSRKILPLTLDRVFVAFCCLKIAVHQQCPWPHII